MKISLFGGYTLTVTIDSGDKLVRRVDKLAREYKADADAMYGNTTWGIKIPRIKVHRALTNSSLVEAKAWVENHFDDNGKGDIKK